MDVQDTDRFQKIQDEFGISLDSDLSPHEEQQAISEYIYNKLDGILAMNNEQKEQAL